MSRVGDALWIAPQGVLILAAASGFVIGLLGVDLVLTARAQRGER